MKTTHRKTIGISSIVLICFFSMTCIVSSGQEVGTFKDKRDGQIYSWAKLGKKMWMTENVKFLPSSGAWAYNDSLQYVETYGYLYDWNTAQQVCPKGWRVPSVDEFGILFESLGGDSIASRKFMEMDTIFWNRLDSVTGNPTRNATSFGGTRRGDSTFSGINVWGGLWSSTLDEDGYPVDFLFARGDPSISRSSHNKTSGFSVRCIRK